MLELVDFPFHKLSTTSKARPYLPILLENPENNNKITLIGQIDTGADECAFPSDIATILGHELDKGLPKDIITGNGITNAYSHTASMEIMGHRYENVLIDFMSGLKIPLLGVNSFLSHFIITIDYPNQKFSLYQKT